jgi:hypothetical protein
MGGAIVEVYERAGMGVRMAEEIKPEKMSGQSRL